jgi:hypothetical protein
MNVIQSALEMVELFNKAPLPLMDSRYGKDHLTYMVEEIVSGRVQGEKAHRWLGYIQGCVVMSGGSTLEEVKLVNYQA